MRVAEQLNTQDLRKLGNIKISKLHRIVARRPIPLPKLTFCQHQQKILKKQKLNSSRRVAFHRKTTVCLRYPGQDRSPYKTLRITQTRIDKPSQTPRPRIPAHWKYHGYIRLKDFTAQASSILQQSILPLLYCTPMQI